jgi:hypothetical protein
MNDVLSAISTLGIPAVLAALFIYVVLRGELRFRYPASRDRRALPRADEDDGGE